MAEVWHIAERRAIPSFILARVKTFPVTRKFAALRCKLRPPQLAIDWIQFLRVATAIMIEYQIGIHL